MTSSAGGGTVVGIEFQDLGSTVNDVETWGIGREDPERRKVITLAPRAPGQIAGGHGEIKMSAGDVLEQLAENPRRSGNNYVDSEGGCRVPKWNLLSRGKFTAILGI